MPQLDPFNILPSVRSTPIAGPPQAKVATQTVTPPQGPTGFWGRISQVGIGKVNLINAYRTTVEHQPAVQSNSLKEDLSLGKRAIVNTGRTAKDVGSTIVSPATGLAKDTNKELIQPAYKQAKQIVQHPSILIKGTPESRQADKYIKIFDDAVKSGKLDKKIIGSMPPEQGLRADLGKIVANGGNSQDVAKAIAKSGKAQTEKTTKIGAEVAGTAALLYGGGETKSLLTGGEKLATATVKNAAATATASAAGTLQKNPNASGKEVIKSAVEGGVGGALLTPLGSGASKVIKDARVILGKDKELTSLVTNTVGQKLLQKGEQAGKITVKGEQDVGSKIAVRTPVKMQPGEYTQRFTKLSNEYDKATKGLEKMAPAKQKIMAESIDKRFQGDLAQLNHEYTHGVLQPTKTVQATSVVPKTDELAGSITKPVRSTGTKTVSGSALKSEQRAVEAGLVKDFEDKAGYKSTSYAKDAENAVKLAHEDSTKALDIATGKVRGSSASHEVAVRRAVEGRALQEGDTNTLQRLATSSQHTKTSESAQRLGAEAFNADDSSPVTAIQHVMAARGTAAEKRFGQPVTKAVSDTVKEIASHTKAPSKFEWQSFVEGIKC